MFVFKIYFVLCMCIHLLICLLYLNSKGYLLFSIPFLGSFLVCFCYFLIVVVIAAAAVVAAALHMANRVRKIVKEFSHHFALWLISAARSKGSAASSPAIAFAFRLFSSLPFCPHIRVEQGIRLREIYADIVAHLYSKFESS